MNAPRVLCATALAVSVIALTGSALADPAPVPAAPAAGPAPSAEVGTPLTLRPSKPLELAQSPEPSSTGWKLAAILAVIGGAAFYWRKRVKPAEADPGQLVIVRRTSVGLRSELLVVNVEGQRLLVGVTPQSIQSLAILDGDAPALAEAPAPAGSVSARFDALLGATEERRPAKVESRPRPRVTEEEAEDLGQARGLLALRRRG